MPKDDVAVISGGVADLAVGFFSSFRYASTMLRVHSITAFINPVQSSVSVSGALILGSSDLGFLRDAGYSTPHSLQSQLT